jgi:hypothetical protein
MLEIGSIVYLKEGTQKLMILNRGAVMEEEGKKVLFDYSASAYPIGVVPQAVFYFNEENIDKVLFNGFHDEDEERFQEAYKSWLEREGKDMEKGNVENALETVNKDNEVW